MQLPGAEYHASLSGGTLAAEPPEYHAWGLSATACDSTGGLLTRVAAFTGITPTVSLNMNYLAPIQEGTHLMIKATVEHLGRTLAQISMDGWIEETGKPAVMATGVYMPKAPA